MKPIVTLSIKWMMECSHNGTFFYLSKMAEIIFKCICFILKFLWSVFLRVQFLKCQHFFNSLPSLTVPNTKVAWNRSFHFWTHWKSNLVFRSSLHVFILGCICFTNKFFVRLEPWCRLYQWCMWTCEPHDRPLLTWCWWRIAWGHT